MTNNINKAPLVKMFSKLLNENYTEIPDRLVWENKWDKNLNIFEQYYKQLFNGQLYYNKDWIKYTPKQKHL